MLNDIDCEKRVLHILLDVEMSSSLTGDDCHCIVSGNRIKW